MRRIGSFGTVVSAAFCAAALLAGCASPSAAPSSSSPPATAPSTAPAAATPSPATAAPSSTGPAASGWKTFTTSDGQLAFDYPAEWNLKDPAGETPAGGAFVEVRTAAGKPTATLRTNMVTGAECTRKYTYSVLDSEPVPALAQQGATPRFVFESRLDPSATDPTKMNVLAYGITSGPEPSGPDACPIFHFFTWPPSGAMFGGAYNPVDTTPGNAPNVDTPEAYKETAEYQDIRKMITSLRPAGE